MVIFTLDPVYALRPCADEALGGEDAGGWKLSIPRAHVRFCGRVRHRASLVRIESIRGSNTIITREII